jgi:hypothetical protein
MPIDSEAILDLYRAVKFWELAHNWRDNWHELPEEEQAEGASVEAWISDTLTEVEDSLKTSGEEGS